MKLDEKSYLERIADALEHAAGIQHEDKGYLDPQSYLERIAIAAEAVFGGVDESDPLEPGVDPGVTPNIS